MSKNTKSFNDLFALLRFLISLTVLGFLAYQDLHLEENIPNIVYLLIGALNGVDAYKLYNDIKKGYDKPIDKE